MAAAIQDPEIDTVLIGIPNYLHKKAALLAAEAGKAVLCTKPLAMSGPEALELFEAVEQAGVFHGYLEDLAYTRKTLKALHATQKGALGKVLWARSRETHRGPHSDWFWTKELSGGGAIELDMVLNIAQLRSGKYDFVRDDIKAVCDVAHARAVKVKVIFENSYLTDEEKITACKLSEAAGADWVKTSTEFASGGATLADLRLMRANVNEKIQVKAAGGVRTLPALLDVIDAGMTRCEAMATATILDDFKSIKEGTPLATPKPDSSERSETY